MKRLMYVKANILLVFKSTCEMHVDLLFLISCDLCVTIAFFLCLCFL